MQILWISYKGGGGSKYLLVLELGRADGKLICLKSDAIPPVDKQLIGKMQNVLNALSLDKKVHWLRQNCPKSMQGYRTLTLSKVTIKDSFKL